MRPLLRFGTRLAVALWLGLYLAWTARIGPAPPTEATAQVRPRVEEPPMPEPAPVPARSPQPAAVLASDLSAGETLLSGGGEFPALSCSYGDFASFFDYAHAMVSLGARFVVVRDRQIVAGVDLEHGRVDGAVPGDSFSRRARDYTGEPALTELAQAARAHFGPGAVVMMLVPRRLDAGLFGGLARILSQRGQRHETYRELFGRYERGPRGGVRIRVDGGVKLDGSRDDIDVVFDLDDIGRLSAASEGRA